MMSDLISRQAIIDAMRKRRALFCKNRIEFMALPKDEKARVDEIDNCISDLVNAPDAELEVFEFCASGKNPCKEYDQQNHCCHRWTKVIRQTVEDVKQQYALEYPEIVHCNECFYAELVNNKEDGYHCRHVMNAYRSEIWFGGDFCSYGEKR